MKDLLWDWCAFCEGNVSFDKSHFLGLLKAHNSYADLRSIFGYFAFSEELVERAAGVIAAGSLDKSLYLVPKHNVARSELMQLGGEWLGAQAKICDVLGDSEIGGVCRKVQLKFVAKEELDFVLQQDIPHYWLFDEIGDAVRASRVSDSEQTYAIFEALYGLAADYYLAWYIGRPLYALEIDLEPYFRFWRAGGKCALTESFFMVSSDR